MARKKSSAGVFPEEIKVLLEEPEHDDPFLMVDESDLAEARNKQLVAVYRLVSVGEIRVTKSIMPGTSAASRPLCD